MHSNQARSIHAPHHEQRTDDRRRTTDNLPAEALAKAGRQTLGGSIPSQTREAPVPVPIRPATPLTAFAALLPELQRAVAEEGYITPTPIQAKAIGHLLAGRDLLGCAQTGTGKTAAFILPILQYLIQHKGQPQRGRPRVLILAPTRELAAQIGESIRAYGRHLTIKHTVIFGGVGQQPQVAALGRGMEIVVATPGRLLDLMQQRHVRLDGMEVFVLDEADRMLDMGFIHDVRRIIAALPARRQSLVFSATLAPEVITLARVMVHDPVHITVTPDQPAVEKIKQKVLFVDKKDKPILLVTLLRDPGINKVLVFTQMKHVANRVADILLSAGIQTSVIHGNKSQSARTQAMTGFKTGRMRVLVATDIAARGIDVDGITHVINYDLPNEPHTYVHRIGRTARAGAEGDAVSFCCAEERNYLRDIERLIRKSVPADLKHAYHSETARTATGAAAQPPPRGPRGTPRSHTPHATRHYSSRGNRFPSSRR
ncbi:MAG: DEAD/DEAH box helicase [Kiritimatiellota bacterium]|nr:DEAD/DEAH box helicase [Kiritimatiellota bacterium]